MERFDRDQSGRVLNRTVGFRGESGNDGGNRHVSHDRAAVLDDRTLQLAADGRVDHVRVKLHDEILRLLAAELVRCLQTLRERQRTGVKPERSYPGHKDTGLPYRTDVYVAVKGSGSIGPNIVGSRIELINR